MAIGRSERGNRLPGPGTGSPSASARCPDLPAGSEERSLTLLRVGHQADGDAALLHVRDAGGGDRAEAGGLDAGQLDALVHEEASHRVHASLAQAVVVVE